MAKKNTKNSIIFSLILLFAFLLLIPTISAADYKIVLNGSDVSKVDGNYKIVGDSLILLPPPEQEWDTTRSAIWTFNLDNPELVTRANAEVEFTEESDYLHSASFFLNGFFMKDYSREGSGQRWYQGSERILLDTKLLKNSNVFKIQLKDWRTKFTVTKITITTSGGAPIMPTTPPIPTPTSSPPSPTFPDFKGELGIAALSILFTAIIFYTIEYFHKIKKI